MIDRELIEGIDYYMEGGLMVFTAQLSARECGYCCTSGCRHCPYGFKPELSLRSDHPKQ